MHLHPAIAALRRDPSLQRRTRTAMDGAKRSWLEQEAALRRELAGYSDGERLENLPILAAITANLGRARAFVDGYCANFLSSLRDMPLGEVPQRHNSSRGFARLHLMQQGGVLLSLCIYEPVDEPRAAETAQFADCEAHELILAGCGSGVLHSLIPSQTNVASTPGKWVEGTRLHLRPLRDARHIIAVEQSLLVLQLTRTPANPNPTREHRLSDGALVQISCGDKRASEHVMALAVLGAMRHRSALGAMEAFARGQGHDRDARWEAVRQLLAMDAARGFALLGEIAASDDELAPPASALRASLIEAHPQLAPLQREPV